MNVSVDEMLARFDELIDGLAMGEELLITRDQKTIARLMKAAPTNSWPCESGSARDKILWIAPDFDSPLDDFRDYMTGDKFDAHQS
jgi:antitoxin (DNA-binding transcriptional repressor) of toxin-antitoxin stability system